MKKITFSIYIIILLVFPLKLDSETKGDIFKNQRSPLHISVFSNRPQGCMYVPTYIVFWSSPQYMEFVRMGESFVQSWKYLDDSILVCQPIDYIFSESMGWDHIVHSIAYNDSDAVIDFVPKYLLLKGDSLIDITIYPNIYQEFGLDSIEMPKAIYYRMILE